MHVAAAPWFSGNCIRAITGHREPSVKQTLVYHTTAVDPYSNSAASFRKYDRPKVHPSTDALEIADSDLSSQSGALCWRMHRGKVKLLLISSRTTGRWVIPKGWSHDKLTAAGSAAAEAWEEVGVEGSVCEEPLGCFTYDKVICPGVVRPCVVSVFAMRVARLRTKFPERRERRRKWFDAAGAARKVAEPELRALLLALSEESAVLHQFPGQNDDVVLG